MPNSIDSALSTKQMATLAANILQAPLAPLNRIATIIPNAAIDQDRKTFTLPIVSSIAAKLTDPTSFQNGDTTLGVATVAAAHITRPAHLSNKERSQGLKLESLIPSLASQFAADVLALAVTQISAANYAAAVATVAPASFAMSHVSTLAQAIAGTPRSLLLKSQLMQNITASMSLENGNWFLPGFNGGIFECDLSTASNSAQAVVATPEAIVFAIALPPNIPDGEIEVAPIELPGIGVVGWLTRWTDRSSRAEWISVEALVGFAPGNPAALRFAAST